MITEYDLVSEHNIGILKSKVNDMLGVGWQPFENLVVSEIMVSHSLVPLYTQVMVKNDATKF